MLASQGRIDEPEPEQTEEPDEPEQTEESEPEDEPEESEAEESEAEPTQVIEPTQLIAQPATQPDIQPDTQLVTQPDTQPEPPKRKRGLLSRELAALAESSQAQPLTRRRH